MIFLVILTFVLILMALTAESVYFSDFEYHFRTRMFNKTLAAKEKTMEDCLNAMKLILAGKNHHGSVMENDLFTIAEQNNITILEYFDNRLAYWSDNAFDVPRLFDDSLYSKPLIFLQNGLFLTRTVQSGNERIVGLLRLRTDYGFENEIIKSGFEKAFRIPGDIGFSTNKETSEFHIINRHGDFLFALVFPEVRESTYFYSNPFILMGWCVFSGHSSVSRAG